MNKRTFMAVAPASLLIYLLTGSRLTQAQTSPVISLVVPFAPGGFADVTARPFAKEFSRYVNRAVVVDNRPGAGGALGVAHVARQRGMDNTLLMALSSVVTIPIADRATGKDSSYRLQDLKPMARITADPTVLAVRADSPYRHIEDVARAARRQPGKISFSSSGIFGTTHIAQAMLWQELQLDMLHVPYGGGAPSMRALLANEVQLTAQGPAVLLPHVEAGSVRLLGQWGAERIAIYPDLPTFQEQGIAVEFYIWSGLFAPMGLRAEQYAEWMRATDATMRDTQFIRSLQAIQTPIRYLPAAEFERFIEAEHVRMRPVIEKIAAQSGGNLR